MFLSTISSVLSVFTSLPLPPMRDPEDPPHLHLRLSGATPSALLLWPALHSRVCIILHLFFPLFLNKLFLCVIFVFFKMKLLFDCKQKMQHKIKIENKAPFLYNVTTAFCDALHQGQWCCGGSELRGAGGVWGSSPTWWSSGKEEMESWQAGLSQHAGLLQTSLPLNSTTIITQKNQLKHINFFFFFRKSAPLTVWTPHADDEAVQLTAQEVSLLFQLLNAFLQPGVLLQRDVEVSPQVRNQDERAVLGVKGLLYHWLWFQSRGNKYINTTSRGLKNVYMAWYNCYVTIDIVT